MKKIERRDFLNKLLGGAASLGLLHPMKKSKIPLKAPARSRQKTNVLALVLGTAQDGGLPHIGCYCQNCQRARENAQYSRLISSLALFDLEERKYFILDATPDIRLQSDMALDRLKAEKQGRRNAPHAVLLTHAHIGHYTGLMFFGYEAMSTAGLPVHCSARMGRFLSENGPWNQLICLENISLRTLQPGKEFSLTSRISLVPFLVPHRNEYSDTIGFRISGEKKTLLYISDIQSWEAWDRSIVEETGKVDIALLDGTFFHPQELPGRDLSKIGHPMIQDSLKVLGHVAQKAKTRILFTHLNHTNPALDPQGNARKEIVDRGFDLAADGEEFFL